MQKINLFYLRNTNVIVVLCVCVAESVVVLRSVCADRASDGFRRPALRVIKMLSQLVHPNIVRLLEVVKDESESAICDGNSGRSFPPRISSLLS